MNPAYRIENIDDVFSPALVFYKDLIRANVAEVVRLAGSAKRLCPHVKTHKCREIVRLQLDAGITTHKCPNVARVRALVTKYPTSKFSVLCDHPDGARMLSAGWDGMPDRLTVIMDVN